MTVKLTLEFDTPEHAIVALGKITGIATAAPKERQGRSDKGKTRGPHKPPEASAADPKAKGEGAGAQSGNPAPSAGAPTAAPSPAASAPKAADVPPAPGPTEKQATPEDAQKALAKLFETAPPTGGIEQARSVLARFGVTRVRDLPPGVLTEFVAKVDRVLKGEAV